jgi:glycine cleavage system H protein
MHYPAHLRYTDSHEYLNLQEGNLVSIGITAYAIDQLGDIVFIDLPAVGTELQKDQPFGTVESVKAVEDLYAPISGTVVEVNQPLIDNPEKIAQDPYDAGWLIKVQPIEQLAEEMSQTMTSQEYQERVNKI